MLERIRARLEKAAVKIAAEVGAEIYDLQTHWRNDVLKVIVIADLSHGGINLDQCVYINQHLVQLIEEEGMITSEYTLEVNSPGLDKPLKTEKDFQRVVGRAVHFYLKEKVEKKLEHIGTVEKAEAGQIFIQTKDAEFFIPLELINKAIQEIS